MNLEPTTSEPPAPPGEPSVVRPLINPPPIPVAAETSLVWGFWLTLAFTAAVAGGFLAAQTLAVVTFMAVGAATGHPYRLAALESDGLLISVATCLSAPVVVGMSVLFAWLKRGLPVREYLALKPVTWKGLRFSFLTFLAFLLFWIAVVKVFNLPEESEFMREAYQTAKCLPLLWLALVLAAPAAEECFFRGFLFRGLMTSRLGPAGAVLFTSLLWAAIHLQYGAVGFTFISLLGLVQGVIRLKTGSVWTTFFVHAFSNLLATLELALFDQ